MGALYIKGFISSASLTILFSLLGLVFQPLIVFVGAGMSLHLLLGNYRLAFSVLGISTAVLWVVLQLIASQDGIATIQQDIYLVTAFFFAPLIFSSLALSRTTNQALAVSINALAAIIAIWFMSVWGKSYFEAVRAVLLSLSQEKLNINTTEIDALVSVLLPAMGVTIFIFLTGALFIARLWQSRAFNPGGFGEEFRRFQLGRPFVIVFTSILLLGIVEVSFFKDWFLVSLLLLSLQGISLVHFFVKKKKWNKNVLIAFYALLFFILPLIFSPLWSVLIIILVLFAVADSCFDFRDRDI